MASPLGCRVLKFALKMVYKFFKICSESDKKYIYLPKKIMRIKNSQIRSEVLHWFIDWYI